MCFPCMDALFQAPATMADKFSCSCIPLGPGFQLYSSFLQTAVSETLSESGKPARIMSWLQTALGKNFATTQQKLLLQKKKRLGRRSVFTMDHPSSQFFQRFFTSYFFCYKDFFSKHKSFPLNHGGGRKSKAIKTMAFFNLLPK